MAFISYKVKQGDSLSAIADDYGVSVSTIQNYNSISDAEYIQVGDILKIPGNSEISTNYTIQYGDSLATIAYKFGTTVSELQSLNNISNPDYIYEGQTIQVSGSSSAISQSNYTIQYGD
ncbi:LysM peptidoglycan-binding domain-containing protein [Staphylococcus xylosus]|uniref:LysM peptidoglycan-binding domain-containing protein n=1 Tax=Staphylococcus xylosus TaxID=1288 RepID=UPI0013048D0D|nr:LysM domain-containing protein [Staphylococcus xylosus]